MTARPHEIPADAYAPRDAAHRYRLYGRRGGELAILAFAETPGGVGEAIVQLDEDERERGRRLVDLGAFGLLDAVEGRWLVLPWQRPEREASFGRPAVPLSTKDRRQT